MGKQSKDEKIEDLEKRVAMYIEIVESMSKRNAELVEAEEGTFMHSPTYLQMKEKISFLESLNILNDAHVASIKKRAYVVEADVRQIWEDNRKLTSEKADIEYFTGITENWHEAWEYEKLKKEIYELKGKVDQKDLALKDRNMEIEKLQERLALAEKEKNQEQQGTYNNGFIHRKGGR